MNKVILLFCLIASYSTLFAQELIELKPFERNFNRPVDIESAGDERIFIVEKRGTIQIMDKEGNVNGAPYLDIRDRVNAGGNEQGLLGLVFHPDYAENGFFYVNYTKGDGATRIARFSVSGGDPDKASPDSEKMLFEVTQPFSNHNAGDLNFGKDGMLYIGLGDGGSGGDPGNRSQTRTEILGKMLRINVDEGDPYSIPEDNPFADDDFTLDEIWALGLRNPWRFSFDRLTGDMWIADVGQGNREEINFQPAESIGGENYGWRCREGKSNFNVSGCSEIGDLVDPVWDYDHEPGNCGGSVTGGFVYRGTDFPSLQGKYIYADYCTGYIWALEKDQNGEWINTELLKGPGGSWTTFGEDNDGELYIADGSTVSRIVVPNTTNIDSIKDEDFQVLTLENPFRHLLKIAINTPSSGFAQLRLFDLSGKQVFEKQFQIYRNAIVEEDLSHLANAVYLAEISFNGATKTIKVLKN